MTELRVEGAEKLERVGRALKAGGHRQLKNELTRGFREAGKPIIADVKKSAASELPHSGGLAAQVAGSSFAVRTRLAGAGAGVRIQGTSRAVKNLRALDNGNLRHPVFGNRDVWVQQSVRPGWFTDPIKKSEVRLRAKISGVLDDVAAKVERSA